MQGPVITLGLLLEETKMRKLEAPAVELPELLHFHPEWIKDPVHMAYLIQELEGSERRQLMVSVLETQAAIHSNIAKGYQQIVNIVAGKSR